MSLCEVTGCRSKQRVIERDNGSHLYDPCELARLRRVEASHQYINSDERYESDHEGNDDVNDRHYYDDDGYDESDGHRDNRLSILQSLCERNHLFKQQDY